MTAGIPQSAAGTLDELLQKLGGFSSGSPGVTRLVYSDAWCDAHLWLAECARTLGLAATPDALGNLFFHSPALKPGDLTRSVLLVGSHLDTSPGDGPYDGACGVLSALLVAAELRERAALPVVGLATCAGEESRFGLCNPGARGIMGLVRSEELDLARDPAGVTWRRALEHAGARGCAAPLQPGERPSPPLFHPALMLELHAEQGPLLESEGLQLGIVDQIAGCRRFRVLLTGETRYAGTTPMSLRRDALAAAAEMALAAERLARKAGSPAVAAVGFIHAHPGTYNEVPGACELGVEVRHVERVKLADLTAAIGQQCRAIAEERGIEIVLEEAAGAEPVMLSSGLADAAEKLARKLKIAHGRLASGVFHDGTVFGRNGVPALLLFLPSRQGVSHSPEEFVDPAALERGHRFLLEFASWLTDARG